MPIEYRMTAPSAAEYYALFDTTGWNENYQASVDELGVVLANSWLVVTAYDANRLVGIGRAITDHVLHAMIYDLIVHPEYHGQGIGSEILDRIVRRCFEAGLRDVQLFSAVGKREFYEKRGFVARPENAPGMQRRRPRSEKA